VHCPSGPPRKVRTAVGRQIFPADPAECAPRQLEKGISHVEPNHCLARRIRYRQHRVSRDYLHRRLGIPKRRWCWSRWRLPRWRLSRWRLPWCSRAARGGGRRRSCCSRSNCRWSLRSLSLRILSQSTVLLELLHDRAQHIGEVAPVRRVTWSTNLAASCWREEIKAALSWRPLS
jgi:hypothetical protein